MTVTAKNRAYLRRIDELDAERDRLLALARAVVETADLREDGEVYGHPDEAIRLLAEYLKGAEK